MAHEINIVRVYEQDDLETLHWVIWPDVTEYEKVTRVADYDEVSNFKAGTLVLKSNELLYCREDITPKAFDVTDWEEVVSQIGFAPLFSETDSYISDDVIYIELDSVKEFFISRHAVTAGVWDITDWEKITDESVIENASVYTFNELNERVLIEVAGSFLRLGGYPLEPKPDNEFTFTARYFTENRGGMWYRPSLLNTMFQDVAETIPVTQSGDKVAVILDQSGNGVDATQSDDALRPTYRTDGYGRGYLTFADTEHFEVPTTETTLTRLEVIPGVGEFLLPDQAVTAGTFRLGPTLHNSDKTWYTGDMVLVTEALSDEDVLRFEIHLGALAKEFRSTAIRSLKSYWENDTAFNQDISDWDVSEINILANVLSGCILFNHSLNGWDTRKVTTLNQAFNMCSVLDSPMDELDVSSCVDFTSAFKDCRVFNQDISDWNMKSAVTLDTMFKDARVFNQPIEDWDTANVTSLVGFLEEAREFNQSMNGFNVSKVTTIKEVFKDAIAFDQPINDWNTENVIYMGYAFMNATVFNQDLSDWDVSKVENFELMFSTAVAFNQDLSNWNMLSATNVRWMFRNATVFNSPLAWTNMGNITVFSSMFQFAEAFDQPLDSWDVSSGAFFDDMFNGATVFDQELGGWDVSSGIVFADMFTDATAMSKTLAAWCVVDITAANVGDFTDGNSLTADDLPKWGEPCLPTNLDFVFDYSIKDTLFTDAAGTTKVTSPGDVVMRIEDVRGTGKFATQTTTAAGPIYREDTAGKGYLEFTSGQFLNLTVEQDDMTQLDAIINIGTFLCFNATVDVNSVLRLGPPSDIGAIRQSQKWDLTGTMLYNGVMPEMYRDAAVTYLDDKANTYADRSNIDLKSVWSGVTALSYFSPNFDISEVTSLQYAFDTNSTFNLDISGWDVSGVTNLTGTFLRCPAFNQDLNDWTTTSVTLMRDTFKGCSTFNGGINDWSVDNVVDMNGMFMSAVAFDSPLTSWNMEGVLTLESMFEGATAFSQDITGWDVTDTTNFDSMFKDTVAFTRDLTVWCVSHVGTVPTDFAANSALTAIKNPSWGKVCFGWINAGFYDATNITTLFSDAAGTTQVTSAGERVMRIKDSNSTGRDAVQTLPLLAPIYRVDATSGLGYLEFTVSGFMTIAVDSGDYHVVNSVPDLGTQWLPNTGVTTCRILGSRTTDNLHSFGMATVLFDDAYTAAAKTGIAAFFKAQSATYTGITKTDLSYYFGSTVTVPELIDWNISPVTNMTGIFDSISSFTVFPENWDTANVTNFSRAFKDCDTFNHSVASWDFSGATTLFQMFMNCPVLDKPFSTCNFPSTLLSTKEMFSGCSLVNPNTSAWNLTSITDMSRMFRNCTAFTGVFIDPFDLSETSISAWRPVAVLTLDEIFTGCPNFNENVNDWAPSALTSMSLMFNGCTVFNHPFTNWTGLSVTTAASMFQDCIAFNSDVGGLVTSTCRATLNMFKGCTAFNQDVSGFDMSAITLGYGMFEGCSEFTGTEGTGMAGWNMGALLNMTSMFKECPLFNGDIGGWNTENCTNFSTSFSDAVAFNQDVSGWDVSSGENFTSMFSGATIFDQDLSDWCVLAAPNTTGDFWVNSAMSDTDVPRWGDVCTDFAIKAWYDASAATGLEMANGSNPTADGDIVTTIVDLNGANNNDLTIVGMVGTYREDNNGRAYLELSGAGTITSAITEGSYRLVSTVPGIGVERGLLVDSTIATNSVVIRKESAQGLRYFASGYIVPELESAQDITDVNTALRVNVDAYTFTNPVALNAYFMDSATVPEMVDWTVTGVTDLSQMFRNCLSFNQDIGGWVTSSVTTYANMFRSCAVFNRDLTNWVVDPCTNMNSMFYAAEAFQGDLTGWNTENVTDMGYMFFQALTFNSDITGWNITGVSVIEYMFSQAKLFDQSIGSWTLSTSLTSLNSMFEDAYKFNQDLNGWTVTNITSVTSFLKHAKQYDKALTGWGTNAISDFSEMFFGCLVFDQAVTGLVTSDATTMLGMFQGCVLFNQDLDSFDVSGVDVMSVVFSGCTAFNGNIENWNTARIYNITRMFEDCVSFEGQLDQWNTVTLVSTTEAFKGCILFDGNIDGWVASSIQSMYGTFNGCIAFAGDLSAWTTTSLTNLSTTFSGASSFNSDIGSWDVSRVPGFAGTFNGATIFNQDLTDWCVTDTAAEPADFATNSALTAGNKPVWGTCPTD